MYISVQQATVLGLAMDIWENTSILLVGLGHAICGVRDQPKCSPTFGKHGVGGCRTGSVFQIALACPPCRVALLKLFVIAESSASRGEHMLFRRMLQAVHRVQ